ncbi:hypothetical protein N7537_005546 [Penicillium hordei]|uniref:Uncharacterized protein n=1 Tax=Penicillium hordei TaxID=40994 RepID=A0AAD6H3L2_9EURO|nr:uncharacterized protein N7537_005546 [Penicillium hordei]KAJ5602590.1 hypothetical protein N7537_005546 [Penicillium hordei]
MSVSCSSSLVTSPVNVGGAAPNALYSQGLVVGGMVYLSGVTGVNPVTGSLVEGTVEARTTQIFENISRILETAGSHIDKTVKLSIFLISMSDYTLMNKAYSKVFSQGVKPVCFTEITANSLPKDQF